MKAEIDMTLPSGVIDVVSALNAAGYARGLNFKSAQILNKTGATICYARRPDVDNNNGKPIDKDKKSRNLVSGKAGIDGIYLYSAAGGTAQFIGETW